MISVLILSNSVSNRIFIRKKLEQHSDITIVSDEILFHSTLNEKSLKLADIILVDCDIDTINLLRHSNNIKESNSTILAIINTNNIHESSSYISLQIGASDYIHMDENTLLSRDDLFEKKLVEKIQLWSQQNRAQTKDCTSVKIESTLQNLAKEIPIESHNGIISLTPIPRVCPKKIELIVIGVSTGGPITLVSLLKNLHPLNCPIVIAQHMPKNFTNSLASHLQKETGMNVIEGYHALPLTPKTIVIASGGNDSAVQKIQDGRILLIEKQSNQSYFHPSVDVLFSSAAHANIPTLGIIMTGMGADGTIGSQHLKMKNNLIIAQEPSTCIVNSMPNSVIKEGYADYIWPPHKIAEALSMWCSEKKNL